MEAVVSYGKLRQCLALVLAQGGERDGQALAEFTLVLAFVAMAAVLALTALGLTVGGFYDTFAGLIGG